MTHSDDSAGAISLLRAVLLLDIYFFTFLNHIYFYFCDLVSINFAFFGNKISVSTACISHLHLPNPDTHVYGPHVTDTSFDL